MPDITITIKDDMWDRFKAGFLKSRPVGEEFDLTDDEWIELQCQLLIHGPAVRGDDEIQSEQTPPEKPVFIDMPLKARKKTKEVQDAN